MAPSMTTPPPTWEGSNLHSGILSLLKDTLYQEVREREREGEEERVREEVRKEDLSLSHSLSHSLPPSLLSYRFPVVSLCIIRFTNNSFIYQLHSMNNLNYYKQNYYCMMTISIIPQANVVSFQLP